MWTAVMGCGHAAISPQLRGARAVMQEAREGAAAQLEPAELLVAQRLLTQAEAADDGSPREAHMAYLAERSTRVAMADARREQVQQGIAEDQHAYQRELERVARERGVQLDQTQRSLAETSHTVTEQREAIAQHETALAAEQQGHQDAERRASEALARLQALASVRVEPTETVITIGGEVLFQTGRSELRPEARDRLSPVADAIRATGDTAVINGYTDSRGSDDRNRQLSQRRAESVREYLISAGIPAEQVRAEGHGAADPVAPNDTVEGRAYNRRVEIAIQNADSTTRSIAPAVVTH